MLFGPGSPTEVVLHITELIHDRGLCSAVCGFANGITSKPHEYIPFLLVSDGTVPLSDVLGVYQFLETCQCFIVRVNGFCKGQIPRSVLMTRIDEGGIRERAQIGQRRVHLRAVPFEETTATTGKECVPGEDHGGGTRNGLICHVLADGIFGVAWGCKALDVQGPNGECICIFYNLSDRFDVFAPSVDGRAGELECKLMIPARMVIVMMRSETSDYFDIEPLSGGDDFRDVERVDGGGFF